jgi:ABC-type nickel/cobalt efflux system permease component RcnA
VLYCFTGWYSTASARRAWVEEEPLELLILQVWAEDALSPARAKKNIREKSLEYFVSRRFDLPLTLALRATHTRTHALAPVQRQTHTHTHTHTHTRLDKQEAQHILVWTWLVVGLRDEGLGFRV